QSIRFTLPMSASDTRLVWVRLRFCLVDILVKMWLLKAFFLVILPVPVMLKRFLALELVFIFGMTVIYIYELEFYFGFRISDVRICFFLFPHLHIHTSAHLHIYFLAPFGVTVKNIRLPSSLGSCSTFPTSSSACA